MFGDIGAPELLILLAIVVVLFGAGRVAQIGSGLGRGIREFRRELKGSDESQPQLGGESQGSTPSARALQVPSPSDDGTIVKITDDRQRFLRH